MITPERSYGFLMLTVAMVLAIAALLLGLALGVAAARYGRGLVGWLLAAYVVLFLDHVNRGFRALEVLAVMSLAFLAGPLGYYAGRTRGRRVRARATDARRPPSDRAASVAKICFRQTGKTRSARPLPSGEGSSAGISEHR